MSRHPRSSIALVSLAIGWIAAISHGGICYGGLPAKLFSTAVQGKTWVSFPAEGFSAPACGVVYRLGDMVECGVPLGGIDTGCIDLETSGLLGYSTIFNTHVPRGGPINLPILGLSTGGKTWVLCAKRPKPGWGKNDWGVDERMVLPVRSELKLEGVETAKEIHYWGHYPVADLEFDTDAPLQVGLRAWSPFLPGDVVTSAMPAMIFEAHIRNPSGSRQKGTIAFSFPGPDPKEAGGRSSREPFAIGGIRSSRSLGLATIGYVGSEVRGKLASYVLGVIHRGKTRPRSTSAANWRRRASVGENRHGAAAGRDDAAGSVGGRRFLASGRRRKGRAVCRDLVCADVERRRLQLGDESAEGLHRLAADVHPHVREILPDPCETALLVAREHRSLLRRVLAWQQVVYADSSLPIWLRDSLVNMLHLITEDGLWAQAKAPIPGWAKEKDGLYGMIECPRECPQIECIPCSFYGTLPLAYFFPELALSTLRGYKGYQFEEGAVPWIFGGCTEGSPYIDFAMPHRGYQITLNGPCYVAMVDRYLMCHDSKGLLREFYPSVKKSVAYTIGLQSRARRRGEHARPSGQHERLQLGDRVVRVRPLGRHRAARRRSPSGHAGDGPTDGRARRRPAIRRAMPHVDRPGPEKPQHEDVERPVLLDALGREGGQEVRPGFCQPVGWPMDHPFPRPPRRIPGGPRSHGARTIEELNMSASPYGAISFIKPDKTVLRPHEFPLASFYHPYDFFLPEVMMLGMTYMYDGQNELGLELTRRSMDNIVCKQGSRWYMPVIILGDTGKRSSGTDYYQNMMLWSLPAAMEGKSLDAVCRPGGLVDRMIKAAAEK